MRNYDNVDLRQRVLNLGDYLRLGNVGGEYSPARYMQYDMLLDDVITQLFLYGEARVVMPFAAKEVGDEQAYSPP